MSGKQYNISSSIGTDYLTIRQGTYDGPVVASGTSPVSFTAPTSGSYYIHINTDSDCGTESGCRYLTIQCSSCTPPGCTNTSSYLSITAPTTNIPAQITTCMFAGEYNTVNNCAAGNNYTFTATGGSGNYITVHQGTYNGPVIGAGPSPLTVTCTASGSLYVHVNTNSACGTDASCHTTTVTCETCSPPGCTNTTAYQSTNAPTSTTPVQLTSCLWAGEYTIATDCVSGNEYTFTATGGTSNYITVRQGTYDGPVIGSGFSPLTVTCTSSGNLYVHLNTNASCGTENICRTVTAICENCQCPSYEWATTNAPTNSSLILIATCNFAGEYNEILDCISGNAYTFGSTGGSGNYITIRQGSEDGVILGEGLSPITVTCTASGSLFMFINTNASCGVDTECHETAVSCSSCASPTDPCASVTPIACGETASLNFSGQGAWAMDDCGPSAGKERIFSFTPPVSGQYELEVLTSNEEGVNYSITDGSCSGGGWECIDYVEYIGTRAIGNLVAGYTYFIVADAESILLTNQTFRVNCPCVPEISITESSGTANDGIVCAGEPVTLTVTAGSSYSWSNSSSSQSITLTPTSTATIEVAVTGGSCPGTASVEIQVNSLPSVTASSNSPLCIGQTLNLQASGGNSYSWTGPNGFSSAQQNPTITNVTLSASGSYQVTVTNSNGCTKTESVNVTVNSAPTATSNSPVCAGTTLTLNTVGAGSYSWTGPNGFSSNLQNPSIPNATSAASGTYTVTLSGGSGCSGTAEVTVTVNPSPTASASSNSPVCVGETLNLMANGGGSYSWTGPDGFISPLQNPSFLSATTAIAGTYTVTVTNNEGCSHQATVTVEVNSNPTASASSNSPVCAGQDIHLQASGGNSYSWTGPSEFSSTEQNPTITNASTAASGEYIATVSNASGCSNQATINIVVHALPDIEASSNSPICVGQTLNLHASGGTSYNWVGPNGFSSAQQNPSITNASSAAAGTYIVAVTDANGCSASASTVIVVNSQLTASSNSPVCEGQTLNLQTTQGDSYTWVGPNGYTSTEQNPSIHNVTSANTGTYTVAVTGGGCSGTASVEVLVNPSPTASASSNSPICEGETLELESNGGGSYSWVGPNGFSSNTQNPSVANITSNASGTYSVTVTAANGCSNSANTNVVIDALPIASFNFSGNNSGLFDFNSSGSQYADTYQWSFGDGTSSSEANPSHQYAGYGNYTVTLTVSNDCGSDVATTTIEYQFIGITDLCDRNIALKIYPNPARDIVTIKSDSQVRMSSVTIYNGMGQVIVNTEINVENIYELNVSGYAAGIYHVSVLMEDGSRIVRNLEVSR